MKLFPLLCFLLSPLFILAQNPCPGQGDIQIFQTNQIGAAYSPNGLRFLDERQQEYFKVPYTSEGSQSTIFASSPWIGGLVNGELKFSGQTYAFDGDQDLYMGPLAPGALPYDLCGYFNRMWQVTRSEIEQHKLDYAADGIIDDSIKNIFGWPAQGNTFFAAYNGFALPLDHEGGWADFADINLNTIYEPHLGEYPIVYLKGNAVEPEAVGWMVFNDQGDHFSTGEALGIELQLTVFGFNCENNDVLNHTLFNTYKVINQTSAPVDSMYLGVWTDYDLGCSEDDYLGSDSTRSSEFVYNDEFDGDIAGGECSSGQKSYFPHVPIQSMTYLSPRMHSFLGEQRPHSGEEMYPTYHNPAQQYNLLAGRWADGTPMRIFEDGYTDDTTKAITKFLYNGNPNDPSQWSWWNEGFNHFDVRAVSSAYLGTIGAGEYGLVETAYTFHQDTTLDHIGKFTTMYANLDTLLAQVDNIEQHCQLYQLCLDGKDCVWPGDFNHNGIADHYDMVFWGVMKDQDGANRDGLINWTGHHADAWDLALPGDLNTKHGDGNGNGVVNDDDIERNLVHYLYTNPYYVQNDSFPEGPEIVMESDAMSSNGLIRNLSIKMGQTVENVLGLAYQFDIDTNLYHFQSVFNIIHCPADSNIICIEQENGYDPGLTSTVDLPRYMFVKTDHEEITLEQGFELHRLFNGIKLRDGVTIDDVPDTVVIRLKNLIALDANGNDLHIGATTLKVPKYLTTSTEEAKEDHTSIYPNPASDELHIITSSNGDARIFNLLGSPVLKINKGKLDAPVDISVLPEGIYFLQMEASGKLIRFVKQ